MNESKLIRLQKIDRELSVLNSERINLLLEIQEECLHPALAISVSESFHTEGDEWSRNEKRIKTLTYTCDICNYFWEERK
jgi:hypothetical protein